MNEGLLTICFGLVCAGIGALAAAATKQNRKDRNIMSGINELTALAKANRELTAKIMAEVVKMKAALESRIASLETQIAALTITPEQLAALNAELEGARTDLSALDALNPDEEPTPTPTPNP